MDNNQILDADLSLEYDKKEIELISVSKFTLLSILSFGLYGVWWMYKSWQFFKEKELSDIIPAARAIFAIFFLYSLFEKIQKYAKSKGYMKEYSSISLFVLFVFLNFSSRLPDPYWMISLIAFVCLIQPLQALNFAIKNSDNYEGIDTKELNTRQIVLVVIGGIFWILVILGLFIPVEPVY